MSGCSASTDGTHAAAACCSTPSCDRQSRASPSPTGRCARPDGPDRRRNRHAEHGSYRPAWTWDDPNCLGVLEVLRREVMSGGIKMETPLCRDITEQMCGTSVITGHRYSFGTVASPVAEPFGDEHSVLLKRVVLGGVWHDDVAHEGVQVGVGGQELPQGGAGGAEVLELLDGHALELVGAVEVRDLRRQRVDDAGGERLGA